MPPAAELPLARARCRLPKTPRPAALPHRGALFHSPPSPPRPSPAPRCATNTTVTRTSGPGRTRTRGGTSTKRSGGGLRCSATAATGAREFRGTACAAAACSAAAAGCLRACAPLPDSSCSPQRSSARSWGAAARLVPSAFPQHAVPPLRPCCLQAGALAVRPPAQRQPGGPPRTPRRAAARRRSRQVMAQAGAPCWGGAQARAGARRGARGRPLHALGCGGAGRSNAMLHAACYAPTLRASAAFFGSVLRLDMPQHPISPVPLHRSRASCSAR